MRYILRFMDYQGGYSVKKKDLLISVKTEDAAIKKAVAYAEKSDARKEKIEVTVFQAYTFNEAGKLPSSMDRKLKQITTDKESYLCIRIGFAYKEKGKGHWSR